MAFAFAQRSAELKAKPPWVEPASHADQVRAALVCAADASQGPVSVLEIIRPAVPHGRESTAEAWNWVGLIGPQSVTWLRPRPLCQRISQRQIGPRQPGTDPLVISPRSDVQAPGKL